MVSFNRIHWMKLSKIVIFVSLVASFVVYTVYNRNNIQLLQDFYSRSVQILQNIDDETSVQLLQSTDNRAVVQPLSNQLPQGRKCGSDLSQKEIDEKIKGKLNFGLIRDMKMKPGMSSGNSSIQYSWDENELRVKERMELRRKHLLKVCAQQKFDPCGDVDVPLCDGNFIMHEYNTTVCVNKKVGSRTWQNHLQKIHRNYLSVLKAFVSQPREIVLDNMLASNKIITVRHPLTRLASGYRNKFAKGKPLSKYTKLIGIINRRIGVTPWDERFYLYWMPAMYVNNKVPPDTHIKAGIDEPIDLNKRYTLEEYTILQKILKPHISFPEFLRYVVYQHRNNCSNVHWRSPNMNCCPCLFDYQYITKMETLDEDLAFVFKELGLPANHKAHVGSMGSNEEKDFQYYKKVPLDVRKDVYEIVKYDMELFDYHLPENFLGEM